METEKESNVNELIAMNGMLYDGLIPMNTVSSVTTYLFNLKVLKTKEAFNVLIRFVVIYVTGLVCCSINVHYQVHKTVQVTMTEMIINLKFTHLLESNHV